MKKAVILKCRSSVRLTSIQGLREDAMQFILSSFQFSSVYCENRMHPCCEKPRDDYPTITRRPPFLLSVSCIERIHTVRIVKQKRCWKIRPVMYLWVRKAWRPSSHQERKEPEIYGTITRAQHRHHPGENHYHQCQGWDENGAKSLET